MPLPRFCAAPHRLALLALCGAGLAACGGESSGTRRPIAPLIFSPAPPADYLLEDPGCQKQQIDLPLTKTTIWAWDGPAVTQRSVDLPAGTVSAPSLANTAISHTTWGDVFERHCDMKKPAGHRCDDDDGVDKGWDLTRTSGSLKICKNDHAYGRQTYEGIALTSANYVARARERYLAVTKGTAANAPAPILLSVLPRFIDLYAHYVDPNDGKTKELATYITHNLAYFPQGQMIAVFPEKQAQAKAEQGFFWESEFVLDHEYGHHIDFTRHGRVLAAAGLKWEPLADSFVDLHALAQDGSGFTDRAAVQGAVSEGFADLLAYYAEGASSRSLVGLPDIGYNRNIANDLFNNGDAKILTPERLNVLLGLTDDDPKQALDPHYQDIHIIGAIIAHAADQTFQTLTQSRPSLTLGSPDEVDQRYRLALSWMDAVVDELAKTKPDDAGAMALAPIGRALQRTAATYLTSFPLAGDTTAGNVEANVCKVAAQELPALPSLPFAGTDGNCGG